MPRLLALSFVAQRAFHSETRLARMHAAVGAYRFWLYWALRQGFSGCIVTCGTRNMQAPSLKVEQLKIVREIGRRGLSAGGKQRRLHQDPTQITGSRETCLLCQYRQLSKKASNVGDKGAIQRCSRSSKAVIHQVHHPFMDQLGSILNHLTNISGPKKGNIALRPGPWESAV